MTTIHLAYGGFSGTIKRALQEEPAPSMLVSFVYWSEFNRMGEVKLREWVLDSGAYTAFMSGKPIVLQDYIDFCKRVRDSDNPPTEIFGLDVRTTREPRRHPCRAQQHAHAARAGPGLDEMPGLGPVDVDAIAFGGSRGGTYIEGIVSKRFRGLDLVLYKLGDLRELPIGQHIGLDCFHQGIHIVEPRIDHERFQKAAILGHFHCDLQQEAIASRGWNLEGLVFFHSVSIGENLQVREVELAVESADASLGHDAQHERMHLRTRTIDFIEEEDRQCVAVLE